MKSKLFKKSGVISVGRGFKYINGKRTNKICTVVGVKKKLPQSHLKDKDIIPVLDENGIVTDVQEVGKIKALENTARMRPCPPSYSIGHITVTAGTLGCYVKDSNGDVVLLSNNHVIAASNGATIGDIIVQPGVYDGGSSPNDNFATLQNFIPIEMTVEEADCKIAGWFTKIVNFGTRVIGSRHRITSYKTNQSASNLVDAAIAKPIDPEYVDLEVPRIGTPDGTVALDLGMTVHKNGRTTGYTKGLVDQVDVTVEVEYSDTETATFVDQVVISGEFSDGGDSGSAIFEGTKLGGLLFAGGDGVTVANRIENVFSLLNISL
jgi:hypothetical protein